MDLYISWTVVIGYFGFYLGQWNDVGSAAIILTVILFIKSLVTGFFSGIRKGIVKAQNN